MGDRVLPVVRSPSPVPILRLEPRCVTPVCCLYDALLSYSQPRVRCGVAQLMLSEVESLGQLFGKHQGAALHDPVTSNLSLQQVVEIITFNLFALVRMERNSDWAGFASRCHKVPILRNDVALARFPVLEVASLSLCIALKDEYQP